ncbi:MAG TPA: YqcI/YcgG family protein [Iamia sp.]|nr:YqcI/YcgG family protein [Iamia sp.]
MAEQQTSDPVILEFEAIRARTHCPFAPSASITFGPGLDVDRDLARVAEALARYTAALAPGSSSGFVLGVRGACDSVADAGQLLNRLLLGLARAERQDAGWCWGPNVESPTWQFEYGGVKMFVNVFGPCYPASHSKHAEWDEGIIVFFQPESSFDDCGVHPGRRDLRRSIRRRFAEAGQPYSGPLIDRRVEALLYVFPVGLDDAPVRWWTLDGDSALNLLG